MTAIPTQNPVVSEDTRVRWRAMLSTQITGGRSYDLGTLVESVVARICDEQSLSISAAAKGMTAVESVRTEVQTELAKAQAIIDSPGGEALKVPFSGVRIDRIEASPPASVRKTSAGTTMVRSHVQKYCKHTPLESLIYTRKMLMTHIDRLAKQSATLEAEHKQLEQKMKRSLEERTRIVSNLSMVSKELYALAKEVAAALPAAAVKPAAAPVAKPAAPAAATKPGPAVAPKPAPTATKA